MTSEKLLDALLSKHAYKFLQAMPRSVAKALSTRELADKCFIPHVTLYRNFAPLTEWDNMGAVYRKGKMGRREYYYYLKNNFSIQFKGKKVTVIIHGKKKK